MDNEKLKMEIRKIREEKLNFYEELQGQLMQKENYYFMFLKKTC